MSVDLARLGEEALSIALELGADGADAFAVFNRVVTVRMAGNSVIEAKSVQDRGLGLRVLKDGSLGFSSASQPCKGLIEKAARSALSSAKVRKLPFEFNFPKPGKPRKAEGMYDPKIASATPEQAVKLAYRMVDAASSLDMRIRSNSGALNLVAYDTFICNSDGLAASDEGTFFEASLTSAAEDGGRASEGAESTAGRTLAGLNPEGVGETAAQMALQALKPRSFKQGDYDVVLTPNPTSDLIIHVASFTSPLLAKMYYPLFLGRLGEAVASDAVSVIDDPSMPGGLGSCAVDDEGVPSRRMPLIENGVLMNFTYDSFNACLEEKSSTGHGFRLPIASGVSAFPGKNYNGEPIPLAANPYMQPGDWSVGDMVSDVKDGLLVKRFHYTRVTNAVRGDYTAVLRHGLYRIEDGEVTDALVKARLMDNILNMLKSVSAVSKNLESAGSWFWGYAHAPAIRTKAFVTPIL